MKRLLLIASVLTVLISFQNCGQQGLESDLQSSQSLDTDTIQFPSSAVEEQTKLVPIGVLDRDVQYVESEIVKDNGLYPEKIRFLIDLKSSRISLVDRKGQAQHYCLPHAETQSLAALLDRPELCQVELSDSKDIACGMAMQNPMARLIFADDNRESLALAAGINTCGEQAIVFCDQSHLQLEQLVKKLKTEYQQYLCPDATHQ
ncbi:MAG: hypothetical protein ACLGGX_01195 [Bdellovibrionia bacterium]